MNEAARFWDDHYSKMTQPSGGRPSALLVQFAKDRALGCAMDLGCARGDDAIWLAGQGWRVTGVDVAETALIAARGAAAKAAVSDRTTFECHDLAESLSEGTFDLISAMFLHTPVDFDRARALQRAAAKVTPGGLLLLGAHGSRAPWSWAATDTVYPTAQDELANLKLDQSQWQHVFVGPIEREANGPGGQTATVVDTVVAVERR